MALKTLFLHSSVLALCLSLFKINRNLTGTKTFLHCQSITANILPVHLISGEQTNKQTHAYRWEYNDLEHDCLFISSPSSCHSIHTMEHEFYECPEYLSNTPAEVERPEEYEYEVQFCISLIFHWGGVMAQFHDLYKRYIILFSLTRILNTL